MSQFEFSEEFSGWNGTYLHFFQGEWDGFSFKSTEPDKFTFCATIDELLYHKDFLPKADLENIYEDFCVFSRFLEEYEADSSIKEKQIADILENKLEYFHMLRSLSELGVENKELVFSELEICKVPEGSKMEYQGVWTIFTGIFSGLSEISSKIKVVFHNIEEYSTRLLLWMQQLEEVGIDVVFSFCGNGDNVASDFAGIFSPLNLICEERSSIEYEKEGIFAKNGGATQYFLEKDRWLLIFFSSFLKMWDDGSKSLKLRREELIDLFQAWWFPGESGRKLMNIFLKIEILMVKDMEIVTFIDRLESVWQKQCKLKEDKEQLPFSMLSIYGAVNTEEYDFFIDCMKKINELSLLLCLEGHDIVVFARSLSHLHLFYQKKQEILIELEERKILTSLDSQLNKLMPENSPPSRIFTLFREKIKFSLQDNEEVLTSFFSENREFYTINNTRNHSVWKELDNIILSNCKFVRIYANIMGDSKSKVHFSDKELHFGIEAPIKQRILQVNYERNEGMTFFLCPYRYFLTFILQDGVVIWEKTTYLKHYENILVMVVWQTIAKSGRLDFDSILIETDGIYHSFIPFLTWKQRYDAIGRAKHYLIHSITKGGTEIREFALSHMDMKFEFGDAFFQGEGSPTALPAFSDFTKKGYHSLHQIPKVQNKKALMPLRKEMTDYVNNDVSYYRQGEWCEYCTQKRNCPKYN